MICALRFGPSLLVFIEWKTYGSRLFYEFDDRFAASKSLLKALFLQNHSNIIE